MNRLTAISRAILLVAAALVPASESAFANDGPFQVGLYERISHSPGFLQGGKEWGFFEISASDGTLATFRLEVTMNLDAEDDGGFTRNGVIDGAVIRIQGSKGAYRSNYEEDKQLGTCVLTFSSKGHDIALMQTGKCWSFGQGVNASGTYRRTDKRPEEIPFLK